MQASEVTSAQPDTRPFVPEAKNGREKPVFKNVRQRLDEATNKRDWEDILDIFAKQIGNMREMLERCDQLWMRSHLQLMLQEAAQTQYVAPVTTTVVVLNATNEPLLVREPESKFSMSALQGEVVKQHMHDDIEAQLLESHSDDGYPRHKRNGTPGKHRKC